jgi:hypothetical protein
MRVSGHAASAKEIDELRAARAVFFDEPMMDKR